jgi:transcriptional regulator with XRE-family HTH domain
MKENISNSEIKNPEISISARLSMFMEAENISKKDMADLFGVTRQNISRILAEKSNLTLGQLKILREKFPRLNIHWLMFGEKKMYTPNIEEINAMKEKIEELEKNIEELKRDKQHLQRVNEQYFSLLEKKINS